MGRAASLRGVVLLTTSLAWALMTGACAEILGVSSELESVASEFCKCDGLDERWPDDVTQGTFVSCTEYVQGRLAERPALASEWVHTFESAGCSECGSTAPCLEARPLCIEHGEPCYTDASCCGFDSEFLTKSYCGFDSDGEDAQTTRCMGDANFETCGGQGAECTEDAQCCGGEGLIALCEPELGGCLALCDQENDAACPGCCATIHTSVGPIGICMDGLPLLSPPDCEDLCETSCPFGFGCSPQPFALPGNRVTDIAVCVEIE